MSAALRRAGHALFVRQRPAWSVAVMRIGFGLTLLVWTATMALDARRLLGSDGVFPAGFFNRSRWDWVTLESTGSVWFALGALGLAAVAVTVGWKPTGWLLVSFVLLVALHRRNPLILNSGDLLLRDLALLLAFCPTGAALSVDRWREHGRGALRSAPPIAPWGLRLVQLQVIVVYGFAFWSKSGELWRNGTAVSTAFRLEDLQRFGTPGWLVGSVVVIAALTWGTLLTELALATLLWVRRLRPALIVLGVLLHVLIDVFIMVGFFGFAIVTALMAFLPDDTIEAARP